MTNFQAPLRETVDPVREVVEQLEEEIVFGRLRPRERLVEEELAARFDVKRHFIRQALFELERVGIVVRPRGRGARVREFTPEQVEDLYMVRELLESKAVIVMPLPAPAEVVEELVAIQAIYSKAVDAGDVKTIFRSNIRFHQVLFNACGNPYLSEAIELFATKANAIRFYSGRDPAFFQNARRQHQQMIEALQVSDRETLLALCRNHLNPSRAAYVEAYRSLFGSVS